MGQVDRAFRWFVALGVLVRVLCLPAEACAGDPYLRWSTLSTPHFRVHYHGGLEQVAQRAGSVAERVHQGLVGELGWRPTQVTDIILTDESDSANGIAVSQPYNSILLYVTAPEDMSALNDYDDWQLDLITHEYTHILHLDNLSGLPALINAVFGKVMTPNQSQPRWILEGLAVAMETRQSTAGRLRNSQFDMFLRADVLENNLATLDQISHAPRRWPGGNIWYLYGAQFVQWISDVYGPDTFASIATHYGRSVIPWGINRAVRRATGRTYPELYEGWKRYLSRHYAAFAAKVQARGVRQGVRLTHHGRVAFSPRFVPTACHLSKAPEILYYRSDGRERAGFYKISSEPGEGEPELVARSSNHVASYAPDCSLVFQDTLPSRRRHFLNDLSRLPAGVDDPTGLDARRERLSIGARSREPDLSPDGTELTYVTNRAGSSTLRIAELDRNGIRNARALVPSGLFEQAYTPRFSPDAKQVAYSVWTRGGYRDIRIVDRATHRIRQVTSDRAVDQHPSWSPDGRVLYFTSDRGGVANVHAYQLETSELRQVTNVINGAYMPEVSPDGRWLIYVGYTAQGFDLYRMPLDSSRFLDPVPPVARERQEMTVLPERWPVRPYNPLPSLRPRTYGIDFGTGTFGNSVKLSTDGADAVGHHAFAAALLFESEGPAWQATLDYAYRRLPFDLRATLFRGAAPRGDYRVGEVWEEVVERRFGFSTGVTFWFPGAYDSQFLGMSYSLIDFSHETPLGTRGDPWAPIPVEPHSGLLATLRFGYSYSNLEGSLYSTGAERGFSVSLGVDVADPTFGSEATLAAFSSTIRAYFRMPWFENHVLALGLSGGASGGSYPRRGLFATGGFVDQPAFDVYRTGVEQSAFVLRGYEPGAFVGSEYSLLNAEYRYPIVHADRGISSLPAFLKSVSATLFLDWGGAFFEIDPDNPLADMHPGAGAELWIQAVLGYRLEGTLRLGIARGFDNTKDYFQSYFVAASAF